MLDTLPAPRLYFGNGTRVDAFNFTAGDLEPHWVGRGLARIARFSGNGDRSVSVAQHSYNLSFLVGDCIHRQRAALMHDVPELFTGDVPSPIKRRCADLLAIDDRIIERLGAVFGIPASAFEAIHSMDTRIAYDERLFMFSNLSNADRSEAELNKLGIHIVPITREVAATSWTRRFYRLFPQEQEHLH